MKYNIIKYKSRVTRNLPKKMYRPTQLNDTYVIATQWIAMKLDALDAPLAFLIFTPDLQHIILFSFLVFFIKQNCVAMFPCLFNTMFWRPR